jgi:hypothetical protein
MAAANAQDCMRATQVTRGPAIVVEVAGTSVQRDPVVLGFNLEVVPFEKDFWDPARHQIQADVMAALTGVRGAVFRYPGGSVANRIDLLATLGVERSAQALADWRGPSPVRFGLQEYARFSSELQSPLWLVLNVLGSEQRPLPPEVLAQNNRRIVASLGDVRRIQRVELGNELFLPRQKMTGDEYGARVLPTAKLLRSEFPSLRPVVALAGFDMGPMKADAFNTGVIEAIGTEGFDYAFHYYYDGPPGGLPMQRTLANLCQKIDWLQRRTGADPAVWITEHGRWPGGRVSDDNWKALWPNSYDHAAALSSAEFVLATAQVAAVRGVFLHAMVGSGGPWHQLARGADGKLATTATFEAQKLLQVMQSARVLQTAVTAPELASGPAARAAAIRAADGKLTLLITQRASQPSQATLRIPEFKGRTVDVQVTSLQQPAAAGGRVQSTQSVRFDGVGQATVTLPDLSLSVLKFDSP